MLSIQSTRFFLILCLILITAISVYPISPPVIQNELREVGHEFLWSLGDSTSRVMPIEEVDGTYLMTFESELSFDPSILVTLMMGKVRDRKISHYNVEVKEGDSQAIQYSFSTQRQGSPYEVACRGRALPESSYTFYFTPLEPLAYSPPSDASHDRRYIWLSILLGGAVIGFIYYKRSGNGETLVRALPRIGMYTYDERKMQLYGEGHNIPLSGKENELLFKLYNHKNETVSREDLLDSVWDDEGNYVGRTLDVYISKLRKKLSKDETVSILNVRGVGYKLWVEDLA